MKKTCEVCEKVFDVKPSQFSKTFSCSRACGTLRRFRFEKRQCKRCDTSFECRPSSNVLLCSQCGAKKYGKPVTKNCAFCDRVFTIKASHAAQAKFCSRPCVNAGHSQTMGQGKGSRPVIKPCLNCGKVTSIVEKKKFCSRICYWENRRKSKISLQCLHCNCSFPVLPKYATKRRFCSIACKGRYYKENDISSKVKLGTYTPDDWRGGYTKEFNRNIKEEVRKRARYTCSLCGIKEKEHKVSLHVHHIDYDKTNSSPYNLITLCRYCHGKMHGSLVQRESCKKELLRLLGASIRLSRLTT